MFTSTRTRRLAVCVLGAALSTGIAVGSANAKPKTLSEKVGERISRGVIEESLEALDKQENRERLGRIMGSPQIRKAMHDITASIVIGVFDGVREAKKAGSLMGDVDIGKSIGDGMNKHVIPAAGKLTYRIVDQALAAALADKHIRQVEKMSNGATHAVIAGLASGLENELAPAFAAALDKDIGPAVAQMIERDIMPAVGRGLNSPEMQMAIAGMTRTVATQLVSGTGDALDVQRVEAEAAGESGGMLDFGGGMAIGYAIALFGAFALGTALIVITVLLVRSNRRQRKQQEESKQREQTLMNLLDSLESDHPELRTDVHRLVRDQIHTDTE